MGVTQDRVDRPTRRHAETFAVLGVLALIATIYLSTLAVNHSEAEDSLWYANAITRGSIAYQFHPNHLLYNAVNRVFYTGWKALGYGADAELPAKVLNVLAALAILALVDDVARRARMSFGLRLTLLLTIAFSFGFWWYSVEVEAYVVPLVFAFLALRQLIIVDGDFARWRGHVLLGIYTALTVLLHQQHLILGVVVLAGYALMWRAHRETMSLPRYLARVLLVGAVSLSLIVAAYAVVIVGVLGRASLDGALGWLRSGGSFGGYGDGLLLAAPRSLFGLGRAFVGGHYLFSFPAVTALLSRALPNYDLREETFLVQGFSRFGGVVLLVLTFALLAVVVALAIRATRQPRYGRAAGAPDDPALRTRRLAGWILIAYLAAYGLFNAIFLPESVEVWVAVVPALALALYLLIARAAPGRPAQMMLAALAMLLFVVNFFGSVAPQLDPQRDYWRQRDSWLLDNAAPGDLVVLDTGYVSGGYVTFYTGAEVFNAAFADPRIDSQFEKILALRKPSRVLLVETKSAGASGLIERADMDASFARSFYDRLRPQLELLHTDEWQNIYQYNPKPQ